VLEIVEGEAIGSLGLVCGRNPPLSVVYAARRSHAGLRPSMGPSFKAVNGPVLKHGPRSKETDWWEGLCLHHRPTMIFCERFEYERTCWDPKDGELCLSRAKPEETLVEARRCADVQIAFRTWV